MAPSLQQVLEAEGIGTFFHPRDVEPAGITFRRLQNLVTEGEVEKVGSGLYRLSSVEPTERETVAMVASAIPNGIVCLLTALLIHDIGTQLPFEVWMPLSKQGGH